MRANPSIANTWTWFSLGTSNYNALQVDVNRRFSRGFSLRYGKMESVVIVARNGDQVIYYEDVEDGFNVSPLSPDGQVLAHWCNQDELRFALNAWIDGRSPDCRGPAVLVNE